MCTGKWIPRPSMVKLQRYKDKILKAPRGRKKTGYCKAVVGPIADFRAVTVEARDLPRILKPSKKYR